VVSVTERKEQDLTKRFDNTSIDWAVIESQLVAWGKFYRVGKKLRLHLSFSYVDTTNTSMRKGDKRGPSSATRQMLTEGDIQVDAEQHSSRQSSIWREVYKTMRCTGPSCNKGPHCWCDPVGKMHYKLYTHYMQSLVIHVQNGNTLQTYKDVPWDIRWQLYDEEAQSLERHKKPSTTFVASLPSINIVLPTSSYQTSHLVSSSVETPAPGVPSKFIAIKRLNIPGSRDKAVEEYCAWHKSQVTKPALKVGYQKACDVIIENGMTLKLIHRDPNPEFLIKEGVKRGIAEHVIDDINYWVKRIKQVETED
jgi:hypothetical protein